MNENNIKFISIGRLEYTQMNFIVTLLRPTTNYRRLHSYSPNTSRPVKDRLSLLLIIKIHKTNHLNLVNANDTLQ